MQNTTKTALIAFSLGSILGGLAMDRSAEGNDPIPQEPIAHLETTTTTAAIQEDDPGWNCLQHGNRTCGQYPSIRVQVDPSGHISIFWGTDLIGWGDLEGAVQD